MQPSVAKVNISPFRKNFLPVVLYAVLLEKYYMKKLLLALLIAGIPIISIAQEDTSLVNRVNAMLSFTQVKDLERIMDYTYPKLFTIVPKEALIAAMKSAFESEEFIIELDSVKILKIFPIFKINDTSYVKVKHSMLMKMKYVESYDSAQKEQKELMVSLMSQKFGEGNVRFDPVANSVNIYMTPDMVGIKDRSSKWTFANLNEDNPQMLNMLFGKQVLDKLKEYQ
jgi:hypothetical protein